MERLGRLMKLRRVRLVGCGHYGKRYFNSEGYPDPTAGKAIERSQDIINVSARSRTEGKEQVLNRKIPPVSRMRATLEGMGI